MGAPDIVRKVMGECVILRCEYMLTTATLEYEAWCPDFDALSECAATPTYDVVYSEDTDTVTWSRQEG
jgi:hypothetical protein